MLPAAVCGAHTQGLQGGEAVQEAEHRGSRHPVLHCEAQVGELRVAADQLARLCQGQAGQSPEGQRGEAPQTAGPVSPARTVCDAQLR